MATIKKYKKKDGATAYMFNTYLGIDPKTGKKRRTTRRGFATKKDARLALARIETGADTPQSNNQKELTPKEKYITFADVFEAWDKQYINTVKVRTYNNSSFYFDVILSLFGDEKIKEITLEDCQDAVNDWSTRYKSYKAFKSYASRIFDHAIRLKVISENPMSLVIVPKVQIEIPEDDSLFYTRDELTDFLNWININRPFKDLILFRLLAFTGMRIGEVCALTWSDVDFKESQININKTLGYTNKEYLLSSTKTKKSVRTVSIDGKTMTLLKKWKFTQASDLLSYGRIKKSDKEQLIVHAQDNTFLKLTNYPRYVMQRYPGKKIKVHGLRHTHASLLFEAGASIKEVQVRLGHADVSTTMNIYAHVSKSANKEVTEKFSNFMQI